jgi:hypothetical protein
MNTPGATRTAPPAGHGPTAPPPNRPERDTPGEAGPPSGRRPIGWGLALIGAGALWLLALTGVAIPWELVLPVAMIGVGALLLLGGRLVTHSGLIGLGVVLSVLALAMTVTPGAVAISAGDRNHVVTDLADLESDYRLGAGTMVIDLRNLELPVGTTEVDAGVGMGELVVLVPRQLAVEGDSRVGMGDIVAFGTSRGGIAPTLTFEEPGSDGARTLVLDLRVGLGSIEVAR